MLISRLSSDTAVRCIFPQAVRIRAASSISQQKRKSRFPAADEGLSLDHVRALYLALSPKKKNVYTDAGRILALWSFDIWVAYSIDDRQFLMRSKVLALYRSFCRETKGELAFVQGFTGSCADCVYTYEGLGSLSARWETVDWIRSEFEQHRNERNLVSGALYSLTFSQHAEKGSANLKQAKIKALLSNGKRQLKQLSNSGMLVGHDGENFRGRRAIN